MDKLRVLTTDDDEQSCKVLSALFEKNGWETTQAGTVAEGLAKLDPAPDCLILDLSLPDGDGEAILRKVRENHLPIRMVVVATGKAEPTRLARVAALKPDLLVIKPIDWEVIWRYCDSEMRWTE